MCTRNILVALVVVAAAASPVCQGQQGKCDAITAEENTALNLMQTGLEVKGLRLAEENDAMEEKQHKPECKAGADTCPSTMDPETSGNLNLLQTSLSMHAGKLEQASSNKTGSSGGQTTGGGGGEDYSWIKKIFDDELKNSLFGDIDGSLLPDEFGVFYNNMSKVIDPKAKPLDKATIHEIYDMIARSSHDESVTWDTVERYLKKSAGGGSSGNQTTGGGQTTSGGGADSSQYAFIKLLFDDEDKNSDGVLSPTEFAVFWGQMMEMFKFADNIGEFTDKIEDAANNVMDGKSNDLANGTEAKPMDEFTKQLSNATSAWDSIAGKDAPSLTWDKVLHYLKNH